MKKVLYILNDCMRKFTYERTSGLYRAFERMEEPVDLYIVRSDGYSAFTPEHNCGEYNIYRLPDYRDFDGIFLDINSVFTADSDAYGAEGMLCAVKAATASGKPVISMATDFEGFYYVGIDNYDAMRSVIRYLHQDMGLTDFWFVMGPADNYENQARTNALRDYCMENGLPCGEDRFYAESFIMECGIRGFEYLRARHSGLLPQAVICATDFIALGICHAAESAGYSIPRDLFVTGFDNDDVSAYVSPSLTTVDQFCRRMGDFCVDTMRRIWQGEAIPRRIYMPTELVLRESTGHTAKQSDMRKRIREYIDQTYIARDFSYRLNALQYQLPGCKSIEEMGNTLVDCLSHLGCRGFSLVLDSDLLGDRSMIQFEGHIGQIRDITDGMPTQGYSDNMELVFSWDADTGARLVRQKIGGAMSVPAGSDAMANYLFVPLHFMEYTVGYLAMRDCINLIQIKGVSSVVSTLTMALRNYFSRKNLSRMNYLLAGISVKDELSGLYNRLGYHDLAHPLFRELSRKGVSLGILFLDMDDLKYINDSFGHATGDKAIRCVSGAILRSIPTDAIPVRYGGDEFLVLVPASDPAELQQILEAVSAGLPSEAKRLDMPVALSVSAGFLVSDPDDPRTLDQYVQEADALMYREKKAKKRRRTE